MKKIVLFGLGLLMFGQAMADNVIKLNDESLIEDFVTITVDPSIAGNVRIYFADESFVSVNMNLIEVLPNAVSAIEKVESASFARISQLVDNKLVIEGANVGDDIRVFSTNGTLMTQCKASAEKVTIDLSRCGKGVYVLCVGQKVIKFNKQ